MGRARVSKCRVGRLHKKFAGIKCLELVLDRVNCRLMGEAFGLQWT